MGKYFTFSRITWTVIAVFFALVTLLWIAGEKLQVEVIHTGYTNGPVSGARYALFIITNSGAGNITRWRDLQVEYKTSPSIKRDLDFREVVGLIPGGYERISVPAPEPNVTWRIAVKCSPDCFRASLGELFGTIHSKRARLLLGNWLHVVPIKTVRCDWLEGAEYSTNLVKQQASGLNSARYK